MRKTSIVVVLLAVVAIVSAILVSEGFAADAIDLDVLEIQVGRRDQDNFVAGARLVFTVLPKGSDSYSKTVVSGNDGIGRLDLGGESIREIRCRVECPGFLAAETRWLFSELDRLSWEANPILRSSVRLVPRSRVLGGRVVDVEMQGIPGVSVLVDYSHHGTYDLKKGELPFSGFTETIRVMTDDQGRWKTKGWVSSRARSLRMRFQHPDYPDHGDPSEPADQMKAGMPWWTWEPGRPYLSGLTDLLARGDGVTVMSQGWTLSGRVTDVSGEAIGKADVAVLAPIVGRNGLILNAWPGAALMLEADDAGRFEIKDQVIRFPLLHPDAVRKVLADYEVSLVAGKKGFEVAHETFPYFRTDGLESVLELQAGPLFEGRIVEGNGKAISDVSVSIESRNQPTGKAFGTTLSSGADGRFVWPYPLRGEFSVHFSWMVDGSGAAVNRSQLPYVRTRGAIQRRNSEYRVTLPLTSVRTFVFDEPIKLSGTVSHGVTGKPISEFTVRVLEETDSDAENDVELGRVAGRDGVYEVEVPQGYDNHALSVLIDADGYLSTRAGPNNLRNIPNPLNVNLWPFEPIQGVVQGPDGQVVSGALVHRVSRSDSMTGRSLNLSLSSKSQGEHHGLLAANYDHLFPFIREYSCARTGPDGRFVIGDQPIEFDERPAWAIAPFHLHGGPKRLQESREVQELDEPQGSILVLAPQGYALVPDMGLGEVGAIELEPLAEVTVKVSERGEALAFRRLGLRREHGDAEGGIGSYFSVMTDAKGVVRFQGVIPGSYIVEVGSASGAEGMDYRGQVSAEAGKSLTFEIGNDGHTVGGRLVVDSDAPPIDWSIGKFAGAPRGERAFNPMQSGLYLLDGDQPVEQKEALNGWRRAVGLPRALWVDSEGRFSVPGVLPGRYRLQYLVTETISPEMARVRRPAGGRQRATLIQGGMRAVRETILDRIAGTKPSPLLLHRARLKGYVDYEFVVPDTSEPTIVALGELTLRWAKHPAVGQTAPPFTGVIGEAETLFHSQSLLGQRMVLTFGSGGPVSDHVLSRLGNALVEDLDESVRPILISAILAQSPSAVRFPRVRRPGKSPWLEVFVGDWHQSVAAKDFGVLCVPMFFVIGPDRAMELATDQPDEVYDWLVRGGDDPLEP